MKRTRTFSDHELGAQGLYAGKRLDDIPYGSDVQTGDDQLPFGLGSFTDAGGLEGGEDGEGAPLHAQRDRWLACSHQAGVLGVALYDRIANEVGTPSVCHEERARGVALSSK